MLGRLAKPQGNVQLSPPADALVARPDAFPVRKPKGVETSMGRFVNYCEADPFKTRVFSMTTSDNAGAIGRFPLSPPLPVKVAHEYQLGIPLQASECRWMDFGQKVDCLGYPFKRLVVIFRFMIRSRNVNDQDSMGLTPGAVIDVELIDLVGDSLQGFLQGPQYGLRD